MREKIKNLNKQAQSLLGLVTLITGFALMWSSTVEQHKGRDSRDVVQRNAFDINALMPSARDTGKLVVASAELKSTEMLGDEYLKPGPFLLLVRRVEMLQWKEAENPTGREEDYQIEWVEGPIDFLTFRMPTGHENPLFKIPGNRQQVSSSTFGGFRGDKIVGMISVPPELPLTADMLVDPSHKIEKNKIAIPRDPRLDGPNLGDVRISYQALVQGEYTVMANQADEMTLLGANPVGPVIVRPGRHTATALMGEMEEESTKAYSNLLYVGGLLFFFGLSSALMKSAPNMDLRPKVNATGALAVLIVSVGVTVVVMLLFLAFSFVG